MATSLTGGCVTTGAVLTTYEYLGDNQQDHNDDDDDPKHFHPAWCARVLRPVGQVYLLSSRLGVEVFITSAVYDTLCLTVKHIV